MPHIPTSHILTLAYPYLWDGKLPIPTDKCRYICGALEKVMSNHTPTGKVDAVYATIYWIKHEIIFPRMHNRGTLEKYLEDFEGVDIKRTSPEKIQRYRKAWVKSLIAELRAQGD